MSISQKVVFQSLHTCWGLKPEQAGGRPRRHTHRPPWTPFQASHLEHLSWFCNSIFSLNPSTLLLLLVYTLPRLKGGAGIIAEPITPSFVRRCWDLNSGPHASVANTLPTDHIPSISCVLGVSCEHMCYFIHYEEENWDLMTLEDSHCLNQYH